MSYTDDKLKRALPRLGQKTVEDVLAGSRPQRARRSPTCCARSRPDARRGSTSRRHRPRERAAARPSHGQEGWFNLAKVMGLKFRMPTGQAEQQPADEQRAPRAVPIRGVKNDVPVTFEEGGAVPGDRIVGVLIAGRGHPHLPDPLADASRDFEHERWIDVTWDIDPERRERFPARIVVTVLNEPGTLAQIAQVIGEADGNIDNLRMRAPRLRFHRDA